MEHERNGGPGRTLRRLLGWPFRRLPALFGNPVPPELQVFEAQAEEAEHHGLGNVAAQPPTRHARTKPARDDPSLERQ